MRSRTAPMRSNSAFDGSLKTWPSARSLASPALFCASKRWPHRRDSFSPDTLMIALRSASESLFHLPSLMAMKKLAS